MTRIYHEINVEVSKPNLFQAVVAKQNDCNSRFIKATFVNDGEKIDILPSAKVIINARRSDGGSNSFLGVVNDNGTVTVPLHSWILEVEGMVDCDISTINEYDEKLTCTKFLVFVEKVACSNDDIVNDPQYNVLMDLIDQVNKLSPTQIDTELSETSENAVQNKVIKAALDAKPGIITEHQTIVFNDKKLEEDNLYYGAIFGFFNALRGKYGFISGTSNEVDGVCSAALGNLLKVPGNYSFGACYNNQVPRQLCSIIW